MSERPLTPKQQAFVREYLVSLNAADAYRKAGYVASSNQTAASAAYKLLRRSHIQQAIAIAQDLRAHRLGIEADAILRELAAIAHTRARDFVIDDQGHVTLAPDAYPEAERAVASIKRRVRFVGETVVSREVEIKLWSKPEAVKLAMQHLGLLKDRVELTGRDGGPVVVARSVEELKALPPDELLRLYREAVGSPPPLERRA